VAAALAGRASPGKLATIIDVESSEGRDEIQNTKHGVTSRSSNAGTSAESADADWRAVEAGTITQSANADSAVRLKPAPSPSLQMQTLPCR
jgi:hypothetical protein